MLLDDLLASGHQAAQEWSAARKNKLLPVQSPVILATLVGCAAGRKYLDERSNLLTISAKQLTRQNEPFSSESKLFPDINERAAARRILRKYGQALGSGSPLGYSGSGLLLAFEHSVPDNSPPIFWASTRNWQPLLSKGSPPRGW